MPRAYINRTLFPLTDGERRERNRRYAANRKARAVEDALQERKAATQRAQREEWRIRDLAHQLGLDEAAVRAARALISVRRQRTTMLRDKRRSERRDEAFNLPRKLPANCAPEKYRTMFAAQDGRCWICERRPTERRLVVDHDHKTGRIRGLLCNRCNVALGGLGDDPRLLQRAIEYLTRPE